MVNNSNNFAKAEMAIRKSIDVVFNAFIDPEITSNFWFTDSTGKLVEGANLIWTWSMYNVKVPVKVIKIETNKRIEIIWGEGEQESSALWEFTSINPNLTFVSISNYNFQSKGDDLISEIRDSTGGFSFLLASAKAWLEHKIHLNLVDDKFPKEMR